MMYNCINIGRTVYLNTSFGTNRPSGRITELLLMHYVINYYCVSHIGGCRRTNQDNFICASRYRGADEPIFEMNGEVFLFADPVFGVFDGMGGEECGEIASFVAAETANKTSWIDNRAETFEQYCKTANLNICKFASENGISSMGTTAAMIGFSEKSMTVCNIGDSKIFRIKKRSAEQLSMDHVSVSVFGTKPPLYQYLGISPEELVIEPYVFETGFKNKDRFLICSDGLTDMVDQETIVKILKKGSPENAIGELLSEALKNGGKDNITIILITVKRRIFNRSKRGRKLHS